MCFIYIYMLYIYIYICKYIYLAPGKTWCEQLTHLKRPWCWERLGTGGEGDDRGWDGWMASLTQWTWVWLNSGSWWWTGRPGMLWFMGSQGVRHDWATELNSLETHSGMHQYFIPFYFSVVNIPWCGCTIVPTVQLLKDIWILFRFLRLCIELL